MKKLAIFHHVYQFGNWENIYLDQIKELEKSGLMDAANYLFLGVNGDKALPEISKKPNRVYYNKNNNPPTEYYTLKALYDYSNIQDCYCLFIHTKGVTWTATEENKNNLIHSSFGSYTTQQLYDAKQSWRKYLEYFLIGKWEKCIQLLLLYDTVGTEWVNWCHLGGESYDISCYAGGMWWANSEYVKKLDPNFIFNNMIMQRFACEYWISTKNPTHYSFHNFFTETRNLYFNPIQKNEYEDL